MRRIVLYPSGTCRLGSSVRQRSRTPHAPGTRLRSRGGTTRCNRSATGSLLHRNWLEPTPSTSLRASQYELRPVSPGFASANRGDPTPVHDPSHVGPVIDPAHAAPGTPDVSSNQRQPLERTSSGGSISMNRMSKHSFLNRTVSGRNRCPDAAWTEFLGFFPPHRPFRPARSRAMTAEIHQPAPTSQHRVDSRYPNRGVAGPDV